MKKNLCYLLILMAIAALPLTSCEKATQKEEATKHNAGSDSDQIENPGYDGLSWLQGGLVVVDEYGEVYRRVYGKPLDESQPDVISVLVKDYDAAENLFLSWVAPDKEAAKVEGGYDYNLTSAVGKAQGAVSFRAVDGEAGVLARMNVAEGTDLKHIREVNFVSAALWPENDEIEKVERGKIYYKKAYLFPGKNSRYDFESIPFYCLQGNDNGKEGILIWLSPDADNPRKHLDLVGYINGGCLYHLPTEAEAMKVLTLCKQQPSHWTHMLYTMKANGINWYPGDDGLVNSETGNQEFVLNAYHETWLGVDATKILDMDEEDVIIAAADTWTSPYLYRIIHIRIIPPYVE